MKYFFQDLWQSIQNKPLFSLLLFIQLVVTGLVLYISLTDILIISEKANTAKINWGERDFAFISPDMNKINNKKIIELLFPNGPRKYAADADELNESLSLYRKLEEFYNEITQIDGLTIITRTPTYQTLITDHSVIEGKSNRDSIDLFNANLTLTNGNGIPTFNSYYVGSKHLDFFDIKISEGEYFNEESYTSYENGTQILLGDSFRKEYDVGDTLWFAYPSNENGLKWRLLKTIVCGFIDKDQYFTTVGNTAKILRYDDAAIIPYLEVGLDEYIDKYDDFLGIYSLKFYGANLIFDAGTYDTIMPMIEEAAEKYELTDYIQITKSRVERVLSSNYQDRYKVSFSFLIISVTLAVLSVVFIMLYRLESEIKKNAINILVGQTKSGIILQSIAIMAIYFAVSTFLSTNLFIIYNIITGMTHNEDRYVTNNALLLTLAIIAGMFLICAIAVAISIGIKFNTFSISMMIRGNDIKRSGKMIVYKIMIAVTFIFHSIFMMFISGFAFSLEKIDIYYMGYSSDFAKTAIVSVGENETVHVDLNCEKLGKDIIVNKYMSMEYTGENQIMVRALYLNGNVPRLDIQKGRFFSDEEFLSTKKIAVVGPEIYDKYVYVGEDGKDYYRNDYLNTDFEVIGVFGKEGSVSNMDFHVFVPMGWALENYDVTGNYTLDAKDEQSLAVLEGNFKSQLVEKMNVLTIDNPPVISVTTSAATMALMFVLTMINSIVFCSYYVLKQKHIISVKKFVGFSKGLLLFDTFLAFMLLAGASFVAGNLIMTILTRTVLSKIELFDLYTLDLRTLIVSFIGTAILALVFSAISIHDSFSKDSSEYLRQQ